MDIRALEPYVSGLVSVTMTNGDKFPEVKLCLGAYEGEGWYSTVEVMYQSGDTVLLNPKYIMYVEEHGDE